MLELRSAKVEVNCLRGFRPGHKHLPKSLLWVSYCFRRKLTIAANLPRSESPIIFLFASFSKLN